MALRLEGIRPFTHGNWDLGVWAMDRCANPYFSMRRIWIPVVTLRVTNGVALIPIFTFRAASFEFWTNVCRCSRSDKNTIELLIRVRSETYSIISWIKVDEHPTIATSYWQHNRYSEMDSSLGSVIILALQLVTNAWLFLTSVWGTSFQSLGNLLEATTTSRTLSAVVNLIAIATRSLRKKFVKGKWITLISTNIAAQGATPIRSYTNLYDPHNILRI